MNKIDLDKLDAGSDKAYAIQQAINQLIDELSQLKSESQKRDKQVRKAIKHIVGCLAEPVNVKGWNEEYDKINEILNSTKE